MTLLLEQKRLNRKGIFFWHFSKFITFFVPSKDRDQCEVLLLDGDDHCLSKHYEMAETRILNFLLDALVGPDHQRPPSSLHSLVPLARDGLKLMREGHDLEQAPSTGERESVNEPTRRRESESGI